MQVTERDVEIMKFINEFGFCEILQIEKKFSMKKSRCYQVMKRLVSDNLVIHQKIFHAAHGIFYLTKKGALYTDLPPLFNIPKDNYAHQLAVIEIYFNLSKQYPLAEWVGERRLKRDKHVTSYRKKIHLADGMLLFPDGKEVAIEVELTMKSKRRIFEILSGYSSSFHITEVWYYCAPEIFTRMSQLTEKKTHIKVHSLR